MQELLKPLDFVGVSFFITSMALLAATVFFVLERSNVPKKWQLSMTVMTLVTGIAFVHYLYMRDIWVALAASPITYRYIDWFITVPLQIVEFYLILAAVAMVPIMLFWRLLTASVLMLVFGYIGEAGLGDVTFYFGLGMIAWFVILYEIFLGEASEISSNSTSPACQLAFTSLRLVVTVGWAIYPIGYVLGYMTGQVDSDMLNLIYNLADFVNKIAFGMIIWYAACTDQNSIANA
ncbi:MAG: bacteriorhodopsin-like [Pseudomonadota bacterium]|nr:bacteriorhodopsin-like [Pseudomonadota bacterium]